jgi:hypothetical protein
MAMTAAAILAIPYVPPVADLSSCNAPSLKEASVVVMAPVYALAMDVVKVQYYRLGRADAASLGTKRPMKGKTAS